MDENDFNEYWYHKMAKDFVSQFWNEKLEKELVECYKKHGSRGIFDFINNDLPKLLGKEFIDFKDKNTDQYVKDGFYGGQYYQKLDEKLKEGQISKKDYIADKKRYAESMFGNRISSEFFDILKGIDKKQKKPKRTCKFCKTSIKQVEPFGRIVSPLNPEEVDYCEDCLNLAFKDDSRAITATTFLDDDFTLKFDKNVKRAKNVRNLLSKYYTKEEMTINLKSLLKKINIIPAQRFKYYIANNYNKEELIKLIPLLIKIPPYDSFDTHPDFKKKIQKNKNIITYKKVFGSWFKTLVSSGLLEGNVRQTGRGTMCLANDGCECNSIAEKNVDDWLYEHRIKHTKEPKYPKDEDLNPNGLFRGDWLVGETFIEFFGLVGSSDYDNKILLKKEILIKNKKELIEIYPGDLKNLKNKLDILIK